MENYIKKELLASGSMGNRVYRVNRKFDNVYPYFIQGEVYPGSYYESIFSGLPKGFVNEVETFWYDIDFDINIPNDEFFVGVESMDCQAP